jgi:hypothetical protein
VAAGEARGGRRGGGTGYRGEKKEKQEERKKKVENHLNINRAIPPPDQFPPKNKK